ncbi:MAG: hypothetical protein E7494_16190 [Ruminococcus albus]|nr:hypothetical protein [Ruminococcus albus]
MLKSEMYYLRKFTSREELIKAIEEYITYYKAYFFLNCVLLLIKQNKTPFSV